jgi:hypothetical protein
LSLPLDPAYKVISCSPSLCFFKCSLYRLRRGINVAVTRKHGESNGARGYEAAPGAMGDGGGGGGGGGYPGGGGVEGFAGFGGSRSGGQGPTAVSGNFIQAKRRGVVNGVDFLYTGDVVSVDVSGVRLRLAQGDVVLLSSLGFNAAGEVLNCQCYDVAVSVAIDIMVGSVQVRIQLTRCILYFVVTHTPIALKRLVSTLEPIK